MAYLGAYYKHLQVRCSCVRALVWLVRGYEGDFSTPSLGQLESLPSLDVLFDGKIVPLAEVVSLNKETTKKTGNGTGMVFNVT